MSGRVEIFWHRYPVWTYPRQPPYRPNINLIQPCPNTHSFRIMGNTLKHLLRWPGGLNQLIASCLDMGNMLLDPTYGFIQPMILARQRPRRPVLPIITQTTVQDLRDRNAALQNLARVLVVPGDDLAEIGAGLDRAINNGAGGLSGSLS